MQARCCHLHSGGLSLLPWVAVCTRPRGHPARQGAHHGCSGEGLPAPRSGWIGCVLCTNGTCLAARHPAATPERGMRAASRLCAPAAPAHYAQRMSDSHGQGSEKDRRRREPRTYTRRPWENCTSSCVTRDRWCIRSLQLDTVLCFRRVAAADEVWCPLGPSCPNAQRLPPRLSTALKPPHSHTTYQCML